MTQSDSFYCFPQEDSLMIPTPQLFFEQISVVSDVKPWTCWICITNIYHQLYVVRHPFNKCLRRVQHLPGTVFMTRNQEMEKKKKKCGLYLQGTSQEWNQNRKNGGWDPEAHHLHLWLHTKRRPSGPKRSGTLLKAYSNPGTERRLEPMHLHFHSGALSALPPTVKFIQLPFKVFFSTFILYFRHLSTPRDMILANKKKWAFKRRYILFYEPESLATQKEIAIAPVLRGAHHILQTVFNYFWQYSYDASL